MNNRKNGISPCLSWVRTVLGSIGTGAIVTVIICCIFGGYNDTVKGFIIWMIASILYGIATRLIMFSCKLSLPLSTAIHAVICFAVTIAAMKLCNYETTSLLTVLVPFIIVYLIIYAACYFSWKAEAKRANERLSRNAKE